MQTPIAVADALLPHAPRWVNADALLTSFTQEELDAACAPGGPVVVRERLHRGKPLREYRVRSARSAPPKTHVVAANVSPADYAKVRKAALVAGITVSQLVHEALVAVGVLS